MEYESDILKRLIKTYGVGGSTGTGAELTLMTAMNERYVTEGKYVPILVIDSLALKTVDGQWTLYTMKMCLLLLRMTYQFYGKLLGECRLQ